jgi:hypothetical protein
MDSAISDERGAYMRSQEKKISRELHNLLRLSASKQTQQPKWTSKSLQQPKATDKSRMRGLLLSMLKRHGKKSTEDNSQPSPDYVMWRVAKAFGGTGRSGLPHDAASLLQVIIKSGSGASNDLRTAAQQLSDTVIFKAHEHDGTLSTYTITHFTTPGEHGINKILALNLPPDQAQLIAQRLSLARADLRELGDAYARGDEFAPPAKMNDSDYIIVGSNATNVSAERSTAAQALATVAASAPRRRRTANLSNGAGSSGSGTTSISSSERRRPAGPRARPEPRRVGGMPAAAQGPVSAAASTSGSSNNEIQVAEAREYVFKHAGTYLSVEELQTVIDDTCNWTEMQGIIAERVSAQRQSRHAETAHNQGSGEHPANPLRPAEHASHSDHPERDSVELLEKAEEYLSVKELEEITKTDSDLSAWVHIIKERAEVDAKHGEYLPSYSGAAEEPPSSRVAK